MTRRHVRAFVLGLVLWTTLGPAVAPPAAAATADFAIVAGSAADSAIVGAPASAADSTATGDPDAAAGPAWLRLLVHQPGHVLLDEREVLDLGGRAGRPPIPWTQYTIAVVESRAGLRRIVFRPADPRLVPPWEERAVDLVAGDTTTVRLGRPRLLTSPSGARVLLADEEIGLSPAWLDPTLLPGKRLLIEAPGYQRVVVDGDSVLARAKESGSYRIELAPLDPLARPAAAVPEPRSWVGRHRMLALTASAALMIGGVAAGLSFKNEADSQYEQYEVTGNPREQEDYFNRAQRYDRLSLLGWVLGEAAFFATFFLLIYESPRGLVPTAGVEPLGPAGEPAVTLRVTHGF